MIIWKEQRSEKMQKEDEELNLQLKKWQKKQIKAAEEKLGNVSDRMSDAELTIWETIARAKNHKDVSPSIWMHAERVINKYYKLSK